MFGIKRKRTNTFTMRTPDGVISGKLLRNGDLELRLEGHPFTTVPGNLIPALAHWLSSVNGRFADVIPEKLLPNSTVIPIR